MFGPEDENFDSFSDDSFQQQPDVEVQSYGGYDEMESKLDMDVLFGIDTSGDSNDNNG